MEYYDLHCDTIGECFNTGKALFSNDMHISLEKAEIFDAYVQVFAIWIPDVMRGEEALDHFEKCADYYYEQLKINGAYMKKHAITPILSVEGGAVLGGSLSKLYRLHDRGVKLMTLTWNSSNEIASGSHETGGGLTAFGKEVVKEMNKLKMTVDVSHLNRKSFFDVARCTDKPFIASHSNLDDPRVPIGALRSLSLEQAREIINRRGLIGINFCKDFLQREGEDCFEAVYRRICEICEPGGENAVAFGSDFDGCKIDEKLNSIDKIPALYDFLHSKGFNEDFLNKLSYQNAKNFFKFCNA
ncbi:MAG: Membrane dipeptidase (Peptidase family M19) [Firmicutes bacterium ADurb.Bin300]|nr:MAG: Membrane dipeptidase (Peptidase family M19) [Firmicutes bacterium ADurb.Bin300]